MEEFLAANINQPISFDTNVSMTDLTASGVNEIEMSVDIDIKMDAVILDCVLIEADEKYGINDDADLRLKFVLRLDDVVWYELQYQSKTT